MVVLKVPSAFSVESVESWSRYETAPAYAFQASVGEVGRPVESLAMPASVGGERISPNVAVSEIGPAMATFAVELAPLYEPVPLPFHSTNACPGSAVPRIVTVVSFANHAEAGAIVPPAFPLVVRKYCVAKLAVKIVSRRAEAVCETAPVSLHALKR